jgi:hypothetical protein
MLQSRQQQIRLKTDKYFLFYCGIAQYDYIFQTKTDGSIAVRVIVNCREVQRHVHFGVIWQLQQKTKGSAAAAAATSNLSVMAGEKSPSPSAAFGRGI